MVLEYLAAAYLSVAAVCLIFTYLEQKQKTIDNLVLVLLGYAACLLWPVLLTAVGVEIIFQTPRSAKSERT